MGYFNFFGKIEYRNWEIYMLSISMLLSALSLLELKREIKENHTNNFFLSKIDYFLMKFTSVGIARTES